MLELFYQFVLYEINRETLSKLELYNAPFQVQYLTKKITISGLLILHLEQSLVDCVLYETNVLPLTRATPRRGACESTKIYRGHPLPGNCFIANAQQETVPS